MPVFPLLLIEDKPDVVDWFSHVFGEWAGHVHVVGCAADAVAVVHQQPFASVILDLSLTDGTGSELLPVLRDALPDALVLVFTTEANDEAIILALETGADDYIVHPVSPAVLKARLGAIRRRLAPRSRARALTMIGDLTCDPIARCVSGPLGTVTVTPKEWQVLTTLAAQPQRIMPRHLLLWRVWGYDFDPHTSVLDVTLTRLRQKLMRATESVRVHSLRDVGVQLWTAPAPD